MEERVGAAEKAVIERKRQFSLAHNDGAAEENQSLENALRGLDVLRKEALRWSGSKPVGTNGIFSHGCAVCALNHSTAMIRLR